jgi:ADP-ribose pyrophosphatase YjhB (NUDIX family)
MKIENAFKYCPLCGSSGFKKNPQHNCLVCPQCKYQFFLNPVAAVGVIIEKDNQILLIKRAYPPKKDWWDIPGGFMDDEETVERAMTRELKEELHVSATLTGFVGAYTNTYLYKGITIPTISEIVTATIEGEIKSGDDAKDFKFFPKHEVLKQRLAFKAVREGLKAYLKSNH